MITLTATARCHRCDWTAAGDWPSVDKAAEAHSRKAGHPVGTVATPATATVATEGSHRQGWQAGGR